MTAPRRPKRAPRRSKRTPGLPKRALRRPQERPRKEPTNPKFYSSAPTRPQETLKSLQEAPRGPQETPKRPQETPGGRKDAPRGSKTDPKMLQTHPKTLPRSLPRETPAAPSSQPRAILEGQAAEGEAFKIHIRARVTHSARIGLHAKQCLFGEHSLRDVNQNMLTWLHQIEPFTMHVLQVRVASGSHASACGLGAMRHQVGATGWIWSRRQHMPVACMRLACFYSSVTDTVWGGLCV